MTKERLCGIGLAGTSVFLVCRLALAACGDGNPDPGESCDLGAANGSGTSCCTALCEFRIAGSSSPHSVRCDAATSAFACPKRPMVSTVR